MVCTGANRNFLFERGEVEAHLHETSSHQERQEEGINYVFKLN